VAKVRRVEPAVLSRIRHASDRNPLRLSSTEIGSALTLGKACRPKAAIELRGSAMIVVVGRVQTDAAKRDALLGVGETVAAASREEPGCISYRLYEDTQRANEFVFVEEWADQEALQRHFATAHVREFMQAIPATITARPDVKFHTIASTMDLAAVGA
jgi:quinol monooxygenase YgiN